MLCKRIMLIQGMFKYLKRLQMVIIVWKLGELRGQVEGIRMIPTLILWQDVGHILRGLFIWRLVLLFMFMSVDKVRMIMSKQQKIWLIHLFGIMVVIMVVVLAMVEVLHPVAELRILHLYLVRLH